MYAGVHFTDLRRIDNWEITLVGIEVMQNPTLYMAEDLTWDLWVGIPLHQPLHSARELNVLLEMTC